MLGYQRKVLKVRLWRERAVPAGVIRLPICPWCAEAIKRVDDCVMHEWLIRRAALPVKLQHLIMHEYNCVLAHYQCHADHETTEEFKLRCAKAQFARYGRDKIKTWVASLMLRQVIAMPTRGRSQCLDLTSTKNCGRI